MSKSRYHICFILLALLFYTYFEIGCSSERSLYDKVPFNRITLIRNDTLIQFYTKPPDEKMPENFPENKYYTWYRADSILVTKGASGGKLLHGDYMELYPNKALKQKGKYKNGIKEGVWETWYQNGDRASVITWKNGLKNGKVEYYSTDGKIQRITYENEIVLSDTTINKM